MNRAQRRQADRDVRRVLSTPAGRQHVGRIMQAEAAAKPIVPELQTDLSVMVLGAWAAICNGTGHQADLGNVGYACAMTRVLAEMGYGAEALDALAGVERAYQSMTERWQRTGRIGVTGGERNALGLMVALHDQQLHLGITQGDLKRAVEITRERFVVVAV